MPKIKLAKMTNRQLTAGFWTHSVAGAWWRVDYPPECAGNLHVFASSKRAQLKNNVIIKNRTTVLFPSFRAAIQFIAESLAYAKIQTAIEKGRAA